MECPSGTKRTEIVYNKKFCAAEIFRIVKMKYFFEKIIDVALVTAGETGHIFYRIFGLKFASFLGGLIGDVLYHINKHSKPSIRKGIVEAFSELDKDKIDYILKNSFKNYYKRKAETVFFGFFNKDRINRVVHTTGMEHLDYALSKGKGIILLLSHFGSFLLPLPFLGFRGYKVNQITGRQRHSSLIAERIWAWRKKEADRLPVKFIQSDRFLRPCYEALQRNELVAIAFDGRDGSSLAEVDFLGGKVQFSTGPFELARRTGATIIPAFVIRNKDNTHRVIIEPPFKLSDDHDRRRAVLSDMRNFAAKFSDYIKRYPCHFGMVLYKLKK